MRNIIFKILLVLIGASACNPCYYAECVYRIELKNNTSVDLSFGLSHRFPDTIPYKEMRILTPRPNNYLYLDNNIKWEDEINNKIPGQKLQIFVFSVSKISNQWNWDSVITKYQVLKRFELSAQQLKDLNYTVSYP